MASFLPSRRFLGGPVASLAAGSETVKVPVRELMIGPALSVRDVSRKLGDVRAADGVSFRAPPRLPPRRKLPGIRSLCRHSGARLRPAPDPSVIPFVTKAAGRPASHRPVEGERPGADDRPVHQADSDEYLSQRTRWGALARSVNCLEG